MREGKETRIEEQVRNWLFEEAYKVTAEDTPNARFNFLTQLPYPGTTMLVNVAQQIAFKDRIDISAHLVIPVEYLGKLRKMSEKNRTDFLYDISFLLLANNIPFQFVPNLISPTGIIISMPIWYDGLTKNHLLRTMQRVLNMILLVMAKFQQKFGIAAPENLQKQ